VDDVSYDSLGEVQRRWRKDSQASIRGRPISAPNPDGLKKEANIQVKMYSAVPLDAIVLKVTV